MRVTAAPEIDTSQRIFTDGFGARFLAFDADSNDPVEILRFDSALVSQPDFVTTVGTRVARLSSGRHPLFAPIRRIERPSSGELFLISDRVAGWRLAEILDLAERERLSLDISAVLALLRQLIPAVALFARHQREFAIGTIAPERLVLTPQGRLLVSEYVLGEALGKLALTRDQLWRVYRIAAPESSGATRDVHRVDVLGIGVIALSLLLGRRLRDDEFPGAIGNLLTGARESSGRNARELSPGLSGWLARALQLDPGTAFQTSQELQVAFEELLASEREYLTTTALLETFLERFASIAGPPHQLHVRAVAPAAAPPVTQAAPPPPPPAVEAPVPPAKVEKAPEPVRPKVTPSPSFGRSTSEPEVPKVEAVIATPAEGESGGWLKKALAACAVLVVLEAGAIAWLWKQGSDALVREGELQVQTRPTAARVVLDDDDLGMTPVTARLSPGTYTLKVHAGNGEPRVLVVQIRPGVQTVQYLELQTAR